MSAVNCVTLTTLAPSWPWPTCQFIGKGVHPSKNTPVCGKPSVQGSSYCPEHHGRIWHKQKPTGRMEKDRFAW